MRRVVIGPPGTGKTTRLTALAQAIGTQDSVFISHTKAAALELKGRAGLRGGRVGTMHSVCFQHRGLIRQQVVDPGKLSAFASTVGYSADQFEFQEVMAMIGRAISGGVTIADAYARSTRPMPLSSIEFIRRSYLNWKEANGLLDFNDMLAHSVDANFGFKNVFIDEAQDLSPLQWRVAARMIRHAENVIIVGDDDQAIFEWGGADPHGMYEVAPDAEREVLSSSFRVPSLVFDLAQAIVGRISKRAAKRYAPRAEKGIIREVGSVPQLDWAALAADGVRTVVLYRDISVKEEIEQVLQSQVVPYRSKSGTAPFDSREARAFRTLQRCLAGESVPKRDWDSMAACLLPWALQALRSSEFKRLQGVRMVDCVSVPDRLYTYYSHVSVAAEPTLLLSTIHNFKGAEEDRVVLCMGMSDRVSSGLAADPDPEHRVWYVGVTRARHELVLVHGTNGYRL